MRLKYVGPKPLISYSSITFDAAKEDKFVYINIALQLLKAIEYGGSNSHVYNIDTPRLSLIEMEHMVISIVPLINNIIARDREKIHKVFKEEISRAKENKSLNKISKETLIKNYELMKEYRLQREVNKSVFYAIIDRLAESVQKQNLEYIVTPMYEKFTYVLNSVQMRIKHQKVSTGSTLDIYEEEGTLKAKLSLEYP